MNNKPIKLVKEDKKFLVNKKNIEELELKAWVMRELLIESLSKFSK